MTDHSAPFAIHPNPSECFASLQSEIDELRSELDHSHRLATLGVLAAGVAHEINNVLTPVLAYAQLAASNPADAQFMAKALKKAVAGVETATQITQAILGFAGRPEQPNLANVLDSLNNAIDCLGRTPEKDRIQFIVRIQPDVWVRMRPLALQQILMNLVLNARAALHPRGGKLTISAESDGVGSTIIKCADTGPGIPTEVLDRLFEPFVRPACGRAKNAHAQSKSRKVVGTGLGLAICKRLVDEAGGTIAVKSGSTIGTEFTISLPSAQAHRATG